MPCHTEPPSEAAPEAGRLKEFLHEIHGNKFNHRRAHEGNPGDVQAFTRILCDWCKYHDVTAMSLELQLWWRNHQEDDARHEAEQRERERLEKIAAAGRAKLTPEERAALGLLR